MAKKTHVQLACNSGHFQTRLREVFELKDKTSSDYWEQRYKTIIRRSIQLLSCNDKYYFHDVLFISDEEETVRNSLDENRLRVKVDK